MLSKCEESLHYFYFEYEYERMDKAKLVGEKLKGRL